LAEYYTAFGFVALGQPVRMPSGLSMVRMAREPVSCGG
jgi:hypothetical protein